MEAKAPARLADLWAAVAAAEEMPRHELASTDLQEASWLYNESSSIDK